MQHVLHVRSRRVLIRRRETALHYQSNMGVVDNRMMDKPTSAVWLKWLKIDPYCQRQKCSPINLVISKLLLMAIFAEVTENECINDRHPLVKSDNLTAIA